MDASTNALNWFEISVSDIARAKTFYETVFGIEMPTMEMMDTQMAFFPGDNMSGRVSGALAQSDMHKPAMDGSLVYLNANPEMSDALGRVESAGGKVLMGKTLISDNNGYMAFFTDTEGNRVGMHSMA